MLKGGIKLLLYIRCGLRLSNTSGKQAKRCHEAKRPAFRCVMPFRNIPLPIAYQILILPKP